MDDDITKLLEVLAVLTPIYNSLLGAGVNKNQNIIKQDKLSLPMGIEENVI